MPIYEYRCGNCKKKVSIFSRGFETDPSTKCPQCGSTDLSRLFSTFRMGKGETYYRKDFYEEILGDNQLVKGMYNNDPRALAPWNKKMMAATGDDIAPEYEGFQERLEAGESYESVAADAQQSLGLTPDAPDSSGGDED
jgi:putative FmdB family regulatory protein